MRSRVAWLIGLAGLLAFLRRRRSQAVAVEPVADSHAAELRRKLDENRREAPADETPPAAGLDERRRQVHDSGRAAVDEMRGATPEE